VNKAYPTLIKKLIDEFSKMPGIGSSSAERLTFHILHSTNNEVMSLLRAIAEVKKKIKSCSVCNNLSEGDTCSICLGSDRDNTQICVVHSPAGIISMEKSGVYKGLYHVLLGELSPIDGVGPDELTIDALMKRVKDGGIMEVVIATDFTTEGETTALYLHQILEPFDLKVSRIARGVPVGGSLEFADVATLQRAFEERRDL
jgi:recombination protein RecR